MSTVAASIRHSLLLFAFTGVFNFVSSFVGPRAFAQSPQEVTPATQTLNPKNTTQTDANVKTVLFIGDSLTEGYGVKKSEAFPEIAGEILNAHGHKVKIVNGGISGSVTADADRRVKWFLKTKPDILFLALGGNDGLKGTPAKVIKENLAKAIDLAQANHVAVLLAGIKVYSNFGPDYSKAIEDVYKELAKEKKVQLMPFLLEGVALDRTMNQADMKHPNVEGHKIVGAHVAKELEKLL